MTTIDIPKNRSTANYSCSEMFRRVIWAAGSLLIRFSPRPFFGWRRFVLRCFGARIGAHVHIYPSTRIYFPWNLSVGDWSAIGEDVLIYNLGSVTLGQSVTVSHRAHLCAGTHDYTRADLPLQKLPIVIQDQAWICTDVFVGPNVTIGAGAVVGARSVVMRDVEPWGVVAGNPARFIKQRVLKA